MAPVEGVRYTHRTSHLRRFRLTRVPYRIRIKPIDESDLIDTFCRRTCRCFADSELRPMKTVISKKSTNVWRLTRENPVFISWREPRTESDLRYWSLWRIVEHDTVRGFSIDVTYQMEVGWSLAGQRERWETILNHRPFTISDAIRGVMRRKKSVVYFSW